MLMGILYNCPPSTLVCSVDIVHS